MRSIFIKPPSARYWVTTAAFHQLAQSTPKKQSQNEALALAVARRRGGFVAATLFAAAATILFKLLIHGWYTKAQQKNGASLAIL